MKKNNNNNMKEHTSKSAQLSVLAMKRERLGESGGGQRGVTCDTRNSMADYDSLSPDERSVRDREERERERAEQAGKKHVTLSDLPPRSPLQLSPTLGRRNWAN